MKEQKWIWIGQRISDGFLYSKALQNIGVFFSCDNVKYNMNRTIIAYSLLKDKNISSASKWWKYTDIAKIIVAFKNEIIKYLGDDYSILSYYLSESSRHELNVKATLNEKVFNNQLSRAAQYYLIKEAGILSPKHIVPYGMSWDCIVKELSTPIIMQYDNSSSCSGTFLIEDEEGYLNLLRKMGEPDIAVRYIENAIPSSSHIYISNSEITVFSPSVQIIVIDADFNEKWRTFSYRGNDFGLYNKLFGNDDNAYKFLHEIGILCKKIGIRGLLGVDFMRQKDAVYFTEINFRLQNSTSLLSLLQSKDNNIINYIIGNQENNIEPEIINTGFQFFSDIKTENVESGYYSANGELITSNIDEWEQLAANNYLVFCDDGYVVGDKLSNIRIIGLGSCLESDGNIGTRVVEFANILEKKYE